jgi:hypothetical protein
MASHEHTDDSSTTRWTQATVYPDMWVDPDDDPRETDAEPVGEHGLLLEYLRTYRLTLESWNPRKPAARCTEPSARH